MTSDVIGIAALTLLIALIHYHGIRDFYLAWRFARRHGPQLTQSRLTGVLDARNRAEAAGLWPDCTDRWPCNWEDGWTCRVHCRKCTPVSCCLAHDDAFWAVIGEGRITQ